MGEPLSHWVKGTTSDPVRSGGRPLDAKGFIREREHEGVNEIIFETIYFAAGEASCELAEREGPNLSTSHVDTRTY